MKVYFLKSRLSSLIPVSIDPGRPLLVHLKDWEPSLSIIAPTTCHTPEKSVTAGSYMPKSMATLILQHNRYNTTTETPLAKEFRSAYQPQIPPEYRMAHMMGTARIDPYPTTLSMTAPYVGQSGQGRTIRQSPLPSGGITRSYQRNTPQKRRAAGPALGNQREALIASGFVPKGIFMFGLRGHGTAYEMRRIQSVMQDRPVHWYSLCPAGRPFHAERDEFQGLVAPSDRMECPSSIAAGRHIQPDMLQYDAKSRSYLTWVLFYQFHREPNSTHAQSEMRLEQPLDGDQLALTFWARGQTSTARPRSCSLVHTRSCANVDCQPSGNTPMSVRVLHGKSCGPASSHRVRRTSRGRGLSRFTFLSARLSCAYGRNQTRGCASDPRQALTGSHHCSVVRWLFLEGNGAARKVQISVWTIRLNRLNPS